MIKRPDCQEIPASQVFGLVFRVATVAGYDNNELFISTHMGAGHSPHMRFLVLPKSISYDDAMLVYNKIFFQ